MDQEIKTKWVAALRSGEYHQIDGTLRGHDYDGHLGYCCLGVLAEVCEPDSTRTGLVAACSTLTGTGDAQQFTKQHGLWDWLTARPPQALYDWADKAFGTDCNPADLHDVAGVLMAANDKGQTFETIAALIEEHL